MIRKHRLTTAPGIALFLLVVSGIAAAFTPYLPPNTDRGADHVDIPDSDRDEAHSDDVDHGDRFADQFAALATRMVPPRLRELPMSRDTVVAVNDWHFAMMNDVGRNDAFADALHRAIVPGDSVVVDVGAGSGLLSLMAARLGAARVYAIEGNPDLSSLARRLAEANGLGDVVEVVPAMSNELPDDALGATPGTDVGRRADVLVAELLGTLLLGESALFYMADVRARFLREGGAVIPASGVQHATLVSGPLLDAVARAGRGWGGLDLDAFNVLRDTVTTRFTKQLGFRMADIEHVKQKKQDTDTLFLSRSMSMTRTRLLDDRWFACVFCTGTLQCRRCWSCSASTSRGTPRTTCRARWPSNLRRARPAGSTR